MFKILLTHLTFDITADLLKKEGYEVDTLTTGGGMIPKEEVIKALQSKEYDAISTLLTDKIDKEVIDSAGNNLKIIANYAVGFDNIDIEYAKEKGIIVTNTPSVLTNSVAEHAITLCLSAAKRIIESDSFTRGGKYTGWEPRLFIGKELKNKTIGIIGFGRIGYRVAEIAKKGFGMDVLYYDLKENENAEKDLDARFSSNIDDVLKQADFVSIHLPLTNETKGIIDKTKFAIMKKDAILVNTSRGPVINEKDLAEALEEEKILYAGIDVFEKEPQIENKLKTLNNIIMTPHTASATIETRTEMAKLVAQNIISVLNNEDPITGV